MVLVGYRNYSSVDNNILNLEAEIKGINPGGLTFYAFLQIAGSLSPLSIFQGGRGQLKGGDCL